VRTTPAVAEARRGIEAGYRRNREAFLAKDIPAIMALRTDDFYAVTDGKRLGTRRDGDAYRGLAQRTSDARIDIQHRHRQPDGVAGREATRSRASTWCAWRSGRTAGLTTPKPG
jgi:hypothetical protein